LGAAYDMPSRPVDGMNIMTVYEEIKKAAEHIRSGKGPVFLELKTYRYQGHSISDPGKYRTKEEVDQFKEQDPILILKSYMMEHNLLTEEGYEEIEARIKEQVQACVDFAESSPFPDPAELYEDVYVENDYPFIKD
jgi:pyruvate dehydrogenase E1 component alpha subunit